MENEKSKDKMKEENSRDNKPVKDQKIESELKRFKSHEVYVVNQKKTKKSSKNENSSKDHKKIIINISNTDKINPKPKKSFNNNSNTKSSKNKMINSNEFNIEDGKQINESQKAGYNKSKIKINLATNNNSNKDKHKLTVNNYVNSIAGPKNKINTSKILNEESIQEIDSEDNNINIVKINRAGTVTNSSKSNNIYYNNDKCNKAKNININNKNNYTNNINMNFTNNTLIENNDKNKIIKKINFDEINNSSNNTKNNNIINNSNNSNNINMVEAKNRELLLI